MAILKVLKGFSQEHDTKEYEVYLDKIATAELEVETRKQIMPIGEQRFIGFVYDLPVYYNPNVWYCETKKRTKQA